LRNYNRSIGDASDMVENLQLKPDVQDPAEPEEPRIRTGEINFKDVIFDHESINKASDALFHNFNLQIKPGEKVGLVGHSGGGKTTLVKLIMRFMDIDGGAILIDGQNIAHITQDDLRKSITYVPQEPLLFHRTLAENINYGKLGATEEEIIRVSKMAHAHEFIQNLPSGYDTLVGERGIKLSGGQRQRVAIARAMLKDAPILLLDEATSALDSESEVLIQDALWKLMEGKTAVVIAHRLSTIQKMDRIVVLADGNIAEQGSHSELLKRSGVYAKLWAHQSGGFMDD
jgi:ATP-binding cassette subfamily B protein